MSLRLTVSAAVWCCLAGAPGLARGQSACGAGAGSTADAVPPDWTPPLDHPVTLRLHDTDLREALTRVAAAARLHLAYSSDVLPLDRRVCASFDAVPAGTALLQLLAGTTARPVVAGGEQIVLAPATRQAGDSREPRPRRTSVLARVVITGHAVPGPEGAQAIAPGVVTGPRLRQQGATTLAAALDGAVPGLWMWTPAPASLLAAYGSIRGASSFGPVYPKMYIDGIQVADPLLVRGLNAEAIDHVEVIRGPAGAALFGADAIGGVVNVITRHEGADPEGANLQVRSGAGLAQSAFSGRPVLVQDHTISLRGGSQARSGNLSLTVGRTGDYVPAGHSETFEGNAALRLVGARTVASGSARFYGARAGAPDNPLLAGSTPEASDWTTPLGSRSVDWTRRHQSASASRLPDVAAPQSLGQYTIGGAFSFAQTDRWTHSLVLGIDGYRLANVSMRDNPVLSPVDSALRAAQGTAERALLRVGSAARFGSDAGVSSTVSFALEHTALRSSTTAAGSWTDGGWPAVVEPPPVASWQRSTGVVAQSSTSLRQKYFLTGGLRLERDDAPAAAPRRSVLPMLGFAVVQQLGGVTAKLRGAYGRAIRPVRTTLRGAALAPESQEGIETGLDLLAGHAFGVHLTRFDQLASGLVQSIAIAPGSFRWQSGRGLQGASELENTGAIANRGWELQSAYTRARLTLTGTLSLVDSRVRRVAPDYTGDLRAGDRMLAVPARTASLDAAWTESRWATTWTLARAADWVNYDRLALSRALAGAPPGTPPLTGGALRAFWMHYAGVMRLRATWSHDLDGGLSLLLTGDNLLNRQRGEPDDITIVPGRTITMSLRARF